MNRSDRLRTNQRWSATNTGAHAIEVLDGHDLDHLVAYRLHPNRVAIGFRLLARNHAVSLPVGRLSLQRRALVPSGLPFHVSRLAQESVLPSSSPLRGGFSTE